MLNERIEDLPSAGTELEQEPVQGQGGIRVVAAALAERDGVEMDRTRLGSQLGYLMGELLRTLAEFAVDVDLPRRTGPEKDHGMAVENEAHLPWARHTAEENRERIPTAGVVQVHPCAVVREDYLKNRSAVIPEEHATWTNSDRH